jgi:hypothetical protein
MRVREARQRRVVWGSVATLFSLILSVDANQTVPTTGLAGHWPFDSAASPSPDVSGHLNNAVLTHSPTVGTGLFGSGLHFAAASSQYGTVNSNVSLDVSTGFSVGLWVKPTGTGVMRVMNKWDNAVGRGWHLDINAGAGGANIVGNVRLRVKDGSNDSDYFAPGSIGQGAWKHIAGVYDFTAHSAKLYVNGVQVGATKTIANLLGSINNTTALGIGYLVTGGPGPYFNGDMDEPVVYTRALLESEIQTLACRPQGLTASTNQIGQVTLNWTAVSGAQNYSILRSSTSGGPYALVTYVTAPATSFVDQSASAGTYYYVLQSNLTGGGGFSSANSNQAKGVSIPPPVGVSPAAVTTSESGGNATLSLTVNAAPSGAAGITLTSNRPSQALLGVGGQTPTASVTVDMTGATAGEVFHVTVYGQDDLIAQPTNQTYAITATANGGGTPWSGLTIPQVDGVNIEADVAAVMANPAAGLITDTAGGQASFSVRLSSKPASGKVVLTVSSSDPTEGTVSTTNLSFSDTTWNIPQSVTVTGQGVNVTYRDTPYTVWLTASAGSDSQYAGKSVPVSVLNRHLEVPPDLAPVWGSKSGGCGLTGLEAILALVLARRRRAKK